MKLAFLFNNGAPGRIDSSVALAPSSPLRGVLTHVQNTLPRSALFVRYFVEPLSVRTLPGNEALFKLCVISNEIGFFI